ncbi:MAG: FKBP-type peptidyl-prolyl cis-trans isomerase [Candidatus Marinimicrobia bacterium]|nr:FKBP-type peptidyl-prolyl cis-trans isomerase [Candidatus Neomarinimicrobiota bacterium]
MTLMQKFIILGLLLILIACSGEKTEMGVVELKSRQDSISYSIGMDIGMGMKSQYIEIDPILFHNGFQAGYTEQEGIIPEPRRQAILVEYQGELRTIQTEKRKEASINNLVAAEQFLEENSTKEGVVVLPSGLQYKIIEAGNGLIPGVKDRVKVHYRGTLLNGKEFDSSYQRGEPSVFATTQVIKGWTEALQLMPVGSKWELYIHPDIAYGQRGSRNIEPNSALIFEIELLEIVEQ